MYAWGMPSTSWSINWTNYMFQTIPKCLSILDNNICATMNLKIYMNCNIGYILCRLNNNSSRLTRIKFNKLGISFLVRIYIPYKIYITICRAANLWASKWGFFQLKMRILIPKWGISIKRTHTNCLKTLTRKGSKAYLSSAERYLTLHIFRHRP